MLSWFFCFKDDDFFFFPQKVDIRGLLWVKILLKTDTKALCDSSFPDNKIKKYIQNTIKGIKNP